MTALEPALAARSGASAASKLPLERQYPRRILDKHGVDLLIAHPGCAQGGQHLDRQMVVALAPEGVQMRFQAGVGGQQQRVRVTPS